MQLKEYCKTRFLKMNLCCIWEKHLKVKGINRLTKCRTEMQSTALQVGRA